MTIGEYFKKLTLLHRAMGTGTLLLIPIIFYLGNIDELPIFVETDMITTFNILVVTYSATIIPIAFFLFQNMTSKVDEQHPLAQKLEAYQKFFILRLAMIEGAVLLGLVSFMLTFSYISLVCTMIVALIFWMLTPSKKELIKALRLNESDSLTVNQDSAVVHMGVHPIFKDRMN